MALFQQSVLKKYLSGIDELQNWHELTFKQFLKELKKKKVKLSLEEEAEWMDYFNRQKAKANVLKSLNAQTNSEIDGMGYELYGLSEEVLGLWKILPNRGLDYGFKYKTKVFRSGYLHCYYTFAWKLL